MNFKIVSIFRLDFNEFQAAVYDNETWKFQPITNFVQYKNLLLAAENQNSEFTHHAILKKKCESIATWRKVIASFWLLPKRF